MPAPLLNSPFRPEQTPEANGCILKCRVSPAGMIAWWATADIALPLTKAEAEVLKQSLAEFLDGFAK